MSTNSR